MSDPAGLVQRVKASVPKMQQRTADAMERALIELERGGTMAGAAASAGVSVTTLGQWRGRYPIFDDECKRLLARNQKAREAARFAAEREEKERSGLVLKYDDPQPDRGTLAEFRLKYFGRPTPLHQQAACLALEDPSNLYVLIFGPTGMGKDTLSGDYVAWELAPNREGMRVGWFMETGPFSKRRLGRLGRYLTDPTAYMHAPEKTPGGQKPTGSLIADYGPFRWAPGMIWEDGTEAARPEWSGTQMFFVRSVAPEQDPNLWATGVGGATYGSRMQICVCSDLFTRENQKSPTERQDQYDWLDGTLDTRLDEDGRLVVIGTWLPVEHNYEKILENYTADAVLLEERVIGPSVYQKYSNGVAVVVTKAIYPDPETGEELSYWPDRFPLDDRLRHANTKTEIVTATLTPEEHLELTRTGSYKTIRGLRSKRERSPVMFKALFQQERDPDFEFADFTDEVLAHTYDDSRSFGQIFPGEYLVLGVDPARRYGAAWILWAVNRELGTMTIADFFWGERLGVTGIKRQLIINPIGRYNPIWLAYEDNKEGSILSDPEISRMLQTSGVSIFPHTTGMDRSNQEFGPGALAGWMVAGVIKIPHRTSADKARAVDLAGQFKAWDVNPDRSKAGQKGHRPDDLAMAAWIGWLKASGYLLRDHKDTGIVTGVPRAIRERWNRMQKEHQTKKAGKAADPREVLTRGDPLDFLHSLADAD